MLSKELPETFTFTSGVSFGYPATWALDEATVSDFMVMLTAQDVLAAFIQVYDLPALYGEMVLELDFVQQTYGSSAASTWGFEFDAESFQSVEVNERELSVLAFEGVQNDATVTGYVVIVPYSDGGFGYLGTAVIGEVSGSTITYGAEHPFNPAVTNFISAAALSSTRFVVAYADNGDSDYGKAIIGEVSGTTITYGSEFQFKMAETAYIAVEALTDSKFVIAYDEADTYLGEAVIGSVSGTNITFGSAYTFNDDSLS